MYAYTIQASVSMASGSRKISTLREYYQDQVSPAEVEEQFAKRLTGVNLVIQFVLQIPILGWVLMRIIRSRQKVAYFVDADILLAKSLMQRLNTLLLGNNDFDQKAGILRVEIQNFGENKLMKKITANDRKTASRIEYLYMPYDSDRIPMKYFTDKF